MPCWLRIRRRPRGRTRRWQPRSRRSRPASRTAGGIELIDELWKKLDAGVSDKDSKSITKVLELVLFKGKVRPADNIGLYTAAVTTLGYCGSDGAKTLKKAYDSKRFPDKKDWVPLREQILKSLGRTKQESAVDFLLDEARRSPEDALMAAAGEALGNYADSSEKIRKEIVSDLIKRWGELDERASQLGSGNIQAANARNTLAATSGKWDVTLAVLSRQNAKKKFIEWQSWYNKNKLRRWK